jgi:hypothetical protein
MDLLTVLLILLTVPVTAESLLMLYDRYHKES